MALTAASLRQYQAELRNRSPTVIGIAACSVVKALGSNDAWLFEQHQPLVQALLCHAHQAATGCAVDVDVVAAILVDTLSTKGCQHPQPLVATLCTLLCSALPNSTPASTHQQPWDQHPLCMVVDAHQPLPPLLSAAVPAALQQLASKPLWLDTVRVLTCHVHQRAAAEPTSALAALAAQLRDMLARVAAVDKAGTLQHAVLSLLCRAALLDGSMAPGPLTHALECMTDIAAVGGPVHAVDMCEHMLSMAAALHRPWALAPLLACHARLTAAASPAATLAAASMVLEAGDDAASLTLGILARGSACPQPLLWACAVLSVTAASPTIRKAAAAVLCWPREQPCRGVGVMGLVSDAVTITSPAMLQQYVSACLQPHPSPPNWSPAASAMLTAAVLKHRSDTAAASTLLQVLGTVAKGNRTASMDVALLLLRMVSKYKDPRVLLHLLRALANTDGEPACRPKAHALLAALQASSSALPQLWALRLALLSHAALRANGSWAALRDALHTVPLPGEPLPGVPANALRLVDGTRGEGGGLLRLVRARCLRDLCNSDPDAAVEVIDAIQDCVLDRCPAVAALGVQCLVSLCRADALDAYLALRVVLPSLPTMPAHPLLAVAWVALLGCGGMDADAYPEEATAVLRLLWEGTAHADANVRRAAWQGIGSFPVDAVDAVLTADDAVGDGAASPAAQLVERCVQQRQGPVLEAAAAVLGARVAHETATASGRRAVAARLRQQPASSGDGASVRHALLHRVPTALRRAQGTWLALLVVGAHQSLEQLGGGVSAALRGEPGLQDATAWGVGMAAWHAAMTRLGAAVRAAQQAGVSDAAIKAALGCEGQASLHMGLQSRLCTAAAAAATPARRAAAWMAAAAWAAQLEPSQAEAVAATVQALLGKVVAALTVHMHTPPPTAASSWLRSASLLAARCMAQSGCVDQVSSALTAAVQAFAVASNTDQEPPLDARTLHALATAAAHAAGHPAAAHALFRQVAACVDVSAAVSDMRLAPLALALPALALKAAADPTTPIAPPLPTLATALLQAAKHVARGSAVGCLAAAGGGLLAVQGVCGGPPTRAALLQGVQLLLDVMGTGRGGSGGAVLGLAAVLGGPGALPGVPGVGWGVLEQGPAVKSALQQLQGMATDPDAPSHTLAALALSLLCNAYAAHTEAQLSAQGVATLVPGSTCALLVEALADGDEACAAAVLRCLQFAPVLAPFSADSLCRGVLQRCGDADSHEKVASFALAHVASSPALQLGTLVRSLLTGQWWASAPLPHVVACLPGLADAVSVMPAAEAVCVLDSVAMRVPELCTTPTGAASLWRGICAAQSRTHTLWCDQGVCRARILLLVATLNNTVFRGDASTLTLLQLVSAAECVTQGVSLDACDPGLPMALAALATLPTPSIEAVLQSTDLPHAALLRHGLQLGGFLGPDAFEAHRHPGALLEAQAAALTDACHPVPTWPSLLLQRVEALTTVRLLAQQVKSMISNIVQARDVGMAAESLACSVLGMLRQLQGGVAAGVELVWASAAPAGLTGVLPWAVVQLVGSAGWPMRDGPGLRKLIERLGAVDDPHIALAGKALSCATLCDLNLQ